jgi:hypothetical protein
MVGANRTLLPLTACMAAALFVFSFASYRVSAGEPQEAQAPAQAAPAAAQVVGAIKTISGTTLTLAPDKGGEVTVAVQPGARIVRVAPGQTDLKGAAALQLSDLQVGDRILVRGKVSDDGKSIAAAGIIAMKLSDVQAKQQAEREDWQKRGAGGLVSAVDPAAGVITISVVGPGGAKPLAIDTTKSTILRRYAPGSVQFDDAKASTIDQVKAGDQLLARGARSADGSSFAAEEIVSGSFRNISGTVNSVDAAANAITVTDLVTKKPVVVQITAQSKVVKIPLQVAQGIAARLKGGAAAGAEPAPGGERAPGGGGGQGGGRGQGGGGGQGGARGGAADLQQVVGRLPTAQLTDFMKGDAVMIVSTQGATSETATAITMVGGVEPILAAPSGQQMNLAPWALGGGGGEDAGGGQ